VYPFDKTLNLFYTWFVDTFVFCRRSRGYNCCVVHYLYAIPCLHILKNAFQVHYHTSFKNMNQLNKYFLFLSSTFFIFKIFIFLNCLISLILYTISTKRYSSWHSFLSKSFDDIRNEVEFYIVAYIVLSQVKCIEWNLIGIIFISCCPHSYTQSRFVRQFFREIAWLMVFKRVITQHR